MIEKKVVLRPYSNANVVLIQRVLYWSIGMFNVPTSHVPCVAMTRHIFLFFLCCLITKEMNTWADYHSPAEQLIVTYFM